MSLEVIDDVSTEMPASTPAVNDVSDAMPASAPSITEGTPVAPTATIPVTPAAPQAPAYNPSFKYSVRGQEKEIDEMFRSLIKDSESEKKIKELFERADGLDFVKQDRASLKSEYEGFKNQIQPYMQEYHKFTTLRDKGNLGAAFSVAGISDDQLFEYVYSKIQMEQNPHQAQLYKSHNEASLREIEMEGKLQHYQQMEQSIQQQQHEFNLSQAMGQHMDLVSQVEQKWGRPGSFKDEVVAYGLAEYQRGNHVSEAQAVEAVVSKYKPFLAPQAASPMQQQAPMHQAPATIPNAGSSNMSAVMPKPKNIDDLKRMARED